MPDQLLERARRAERLAAFYRAAAAVGRGEPAASARAALMEQIVGNSEDEMRVRLLLTCLDADECVVSFEPEGVVVALKKGHPLQIELSGPEDGVPELSYLADGIVVGAWPGAQTRAWNDEGAELHL